MTLPSDITSYLTAAHEIDLCFDEVHSLLISGTEVLVTQPVGAPESLLYVWLTVGVVGLAFIVAAVVLGVCVGVMVRYYHAKQKVTLSHDPLNPVVVPHDQFNPLTCKTMA